MKEEKLIRFINNQSPAQERDEVLDWLKQSEAEHALENILQETWSVCETIEQVNEKTYGKILDKIHKQTLPKKKKVKVHEGWLRWGKLAATYLLLLFSAYLLLETYKRQEPIIKELIVFEKVTKAGEKSKLTLPDQSTIILNSLSKVTFDSDFGKNNRMIALEGEAYFKVMPDETNPFVVQTEEVLTTALGTAFNILSKNKIVMISLTQGKVKVSHDAKEVELNPGEMAALTHREGKELVVGHFDPAVVTAWKEGKIQFKKMSVGKILANLEDWYGVTFNVQANINLQRELTGIFDNDNLEDILNGLSFSLNFKYSINGNSVTIKPQTPMR